MSASEKLAALGSAYEAAPSWPSGWPKGARGRVERANVQKTLVNALPALVALVAAAEDFRPSAKFEFIDLKGPMILRAVAAWMDRKDDEWELDHPYHHTTPAKADRAVQADLRRWADQMDAALASLTERLG